MKTIFLFFFVISISSYSQNNTSKNNNYVKQPLDKVTPNTSLLLTAYFSDFGEFGGHKEEILITRKNKRLQASISIYSKICTSCIKIKKSKVEKNEIIILNIEDEKAVVSYLNKLFLKSIKPNFVSHAVYRFNAHMESDYKSIGIDNKEIHFNIYYTGENWDGFETLKNSFKKEP